MTKTSHRQSPLRSHRVIHYVVMACVLYCLAWGPFFIRAIIRRDPIELFSRIAQWPLVLKIFHALAIGLVNAAIFSEIARGIFVRLQSAKAYFTTFSIISALVFIVQMAFMSLLKSG